MEYHQNSTIVAQMQPIFDALPEKLKDEKLRRGMTNQQLSDVSGVPIATTSRIIAGAVSNPGIYHIAPLCAALGVSMDALMGMPTQGSSAAELDGLRQELEHKTELLSEKEAASVVCWTEAGFWKTGSPPVTNKFSDRKRTFAEKMPK